MLNPSWDAHHWHSNKKNEKQNIGLKLSYFAILSYFVCIQLNISILYDQMFLNIWWIKVEVCFIKNIACEMFMTF